MGSRADTPALIALLRAAPDAWTRHDALIAADGIEAAVEAELGLLAAEAVAEAAAELRGWEQRGIRVVTVLDDGYPANLGDVANRPPILFSAGALRPEDTRSVAVVGARQASDRGRRAAGAIARRLVAEQFVVVSGLAEGIDAAAHSAALQAGGRTVAVIGNGLDHCYPRGHAALQRQIAGNGSVVSQFWPDARPSRQTFPMRNAVMAGLCLATVIVEASRTSGTRVQARASIAAGRPVFLSEDVLAEEWAQQLAAGPGVEVVQTPGDVVAALDRHRQLALVM